jgi:hypothetical protein
MLQKNIFEILFCDFYRDMDWIYISRQLMNHSIIHILYPSHTFILILMIHFNGAPFVFLNKNNSN